MARAAVAAVSSAAGTGTLQPPPNLMVAADSDPPLFAMFTQDWLQLQTYIAQALQLPITVDDFTDKYGTFSDSSEVENVVAAMKAVQDLSTQFGYPTVLFDEFTNNPAILESTTPPPQLYTNIVWTAYQIYNAASTFNQTYKDFKELLDPSNCGSTADCAQALTDVLTGAGGLQSTAVSATATVNQLISAMSAFNTSMTTPNATIQQYTASSSQFYKDAYAAAGQDVQDVTALQNDANAAYKSWQDYTISAVTVSVGITILSAGLLWPAGVVAGGVLGHDAVEARNSYNTFCQERDQAAADVQKKLQLITDLGGLDSVVSSVGTAAANFVSMLEQVAAAWVTIGQDLAYIVNTYTPAQLSQYPWVNQALKCEDATNDWQTIAAAALAYTQNSLVPFTSQSFGQPLPTSGNG
jgi:hypothetical protein